MQYQILRFRVVFLLVLLLSVAFSWGGYVSSGPPSSLAQGACSVQSTPTFTIVYGNVTLDGHPAPIGTVVEAKNPRGEVAMCFVVNTTGNYGLIRIYGEDTTANPPLPGMRNSEPIAFYVDGLAATATPAMTWSNDMDIHGVNLSANRPQLGTSLELTPAKTALSSGEVLSLTLTVRNAVEMYGLEATCSTTSTLLALQQAEYDNFFSASSLKGANKVDTAAGNWFGAVSQKNPDPTLSGDGLFATLTAEAIAPGTATMACQALGSDRDGGEIIVSSAAVSVTITEAQEAINGFAAYQGRTEHTEITVTTISPISRTTSTDNSGYFELKQLSLNTYQVKADANLYLPNCITATLTQGQALTLTNTTLLGGDTDDDDRIKINDATLVSAHLGETVTSTNIKADINADDRINIQDLSLIGGNFNLEGCQPW